MTPAKTKERSTPEANYLAPFGLFLREVRQRKGHSLAEVSSLSERSSDPVNKGYLSRVENGQQSIAFSKLITLARIYDCPPGVLVDRLELDMEVASIKVPRFKTMESMLKWASQKSNRGDTHLAYKAIRDYRMSTNSDKERVRLFTSLITPAIIRGKYEYARYAINWAFDLVSSDDHERLAFVYERSGHLYSKLHQYEKCNKEFKSAIGHALKCENPHSLYFAYVALAGALVDQNEFNEAKDYFLKSSELAKNFEDSIFEGISLVNLANLYFNIGNYNSTKRALFAAQKNFRVNKAEPSLANTYVLFGQVARKTGNLDEAESHFRTALNILKRYPKHRFRFGAELELLDLAIEQESTPKVRSILRRLERLRPWLPQERSFENKYSSLLSELQDSNIMNI